LLCRRLFGFRDVVFSNEEHMHTTWRRWLVVLLGLLSTGCNDEQISFDTRPGKKDGRVDGVTSSDGPRGDAGPGSDVVIGNEGSPRSDQGSAADSCVPPTSCAVAFTYPKGSEKSVDLKGSFDSWGAGVKMTLSGSSWSASVNLTNGKQVQYKFVLDGTTWVKDPANPKTISDGFGGQNSLLDVVCPGSCAPKPDSGTQPTADSGPQPTGFDWRDGIMYFVLVDRFANGDQTNDAPEKIEAMADWQGGDLKGVLQKLQAGYFTNLGVNVIWLSSPVKAPVGKYAGDDGHNYTGYHGYWPTELDKVEPRLGDLALLKQVVTEAHTKGIRVVMDYVMHHVHSSSATYSGHKGWFFDLQWSGKSCLCGAGCSWDFSPDKERCWFRDYLPTFDFTQADPRNFSVANAIQWAKDSGVDGFRLDAVKHIDQSWLTTLRSELNAKVTQSGQKFYLVGETFTNDKGLLKSYIDPATKLDGQFDFPLRAQLVKNILMRQGTFNDLEGFLNSNDTFYAPGTIMGTFIGNHDLPRSVNLAEDSPAFGEWDSGKAKAWSNQPWQPNYDRAYQRLGVAFTALMTLPGVPLIYYGDEIGMAGGGDPDNRRFMQWSGTSADQDALRTLIGKLTKIRSAHPALRKGARKQVWLGSDVYAYEMSTTGDKVVVILNRSDSEQTITLQGTSYTDLLNGGTVTASSIKTPARSARVLQ